MFIDAHCHLDHPYFEDKIKDVVLRAEKASVSKILTNGVDPMTNRLALGYSEQFKPVERQHLFAHQWKSANYSASDKILNSYINFIY